MSAHALYAASAGQVPEEDCAGVVCAGESFAVRSACQRGDVRCVAGEDADGGAAADVPHADRLVRGAGEDVGVVRVEGNVVDVLVVAGKDTQWCYVVGAPEASRAIVATCQEVMTKWTPSDVPDGLIMAFIDDKAGPRVKRPEADCFILGGGEKATGCCGGD